MQMSSIVGQDSSILSLICVCLLGVLAWNLFLITTTVSRLLSIEVVKTRTSFKDIVSNHLNATSVLCQSGHQFLANRLPECNFIPVQRGTRIDFNVAKNLEKTRNYMVKRLIKIIDCIICKGKGNRNDSVSLMKIIEAENEKNMDSGNDPIKLLKRSSKSLLVDKEGANERKNTTTTSEEEEAVATRKMEKKEETRNAKKRGRKRLGRERKEANLEVKTVESEETMVDPSLEEKFLVSILEESGVLRANSKELLSIQMNVLRKSHPSKDRISEKEQEDDENLTKADSKEKITDSHHEEKEKDEASKEASKEDETVVKIEATCTDVTRSKDLENNDPKEKEEKVASSPDVNTALKNSNATESTIFLSRSPTTSHGKQEDDLNAIIRRMIMMELKRHRKKETVLKRAHSDTESTLARKKRSEDSRTGLFGGKGQTFFRDLLELEESLRKRSDNESDYQLTDKVEIDRPIAKLENSGEREQNRSRNDIDVTTIDPARYSLNSIGTAYKSDSNIELERKVNASCLKDAEGKRSIRHRKVTVINQQNQANKSTQTEYVYVIRAVRSCPLRKKRVSMQFHINQLASNSDAIYSKTVFASLDLSTFIFRKASDNLIYEKGKGSRSPSYIPTPERHRWKYITPSKNK